MTKQVNEFSAHCEKHNEEHKAYIEFGLHPITGMTAKGENKFKWDLK